jgi:hypothetical protein
MSAVHHLALVLLACGCATGGKDGGDQQIDAPRPIDASRTVIDAPRVIDAPNVSDAPMIDAQMIDAPSGPFCATNGQCTVSGECCVTLGGPQGFCAPGTVIGSACIPIN